MRVWLSCPGTTERLRQTFYSAFMLTRGNDAEATTQARDSGLSVCARECRGLPWESVRGLWLATALRVLAHTPWLGMLRGQWALIAAPGVEQRRCRESRAHPPWAAVSHLSIEQHGGATELAALTLDGRRLYGYALHTRAERLQRRGDSNATEAHQESGVLPAIPSEQDALSRLTPVHAAFFVRYGWVVVEDVVPPELTSALRDELAEAVQAHAGIDLSSAEAIRNR